jgi:cell division protein FtsL
MAIGSAYVSETIITPGMTLYLPLRVQVAGAFLILASLGVKVWLRLETTDLGYRLAKARQEMVELDQEKRRLNFELTEGLSSSRLKEIAEKRLGLQVTETKRVWRLSEARK